ncbi:MAG: LSU ribosomal protein L17p [Brockia lithotrophica]|uniref:Large ribosomal subunit protein bL17 n=1 Tax=Brockia lithotrophica TaxID=933949 RepID=A0A2T5G4V1_9BACL|nr:50S ribosomal protein L17 [Brockia lithotrophica]PTQ51221.1 MAG: LSU ribosomal protein L17p [Brockia lithotrophica]
MSYRKLRRPTSARLAMLRSLVTDLILYERIVTTETRAKEVRKLADKLVTWAKNGSLHARRQAARIVRKERENPDDPRSRDALRKLFEEIAPRYRTRAGGYTRLLKLGPRRGDAAPMAVIEWVEE